jgi:hypothetical protein
VYLRGAVVTREQQSAREVISLYEGGERLAGIMDGSYLVLETWDGRIYRVDPDASRIWVSDWNRYTDLSELETAISDPDYFGARDDFYEEDAYEAPGPVTDFHSDRWAELRAEAKRIEDDKTYYRERGEAA